MLRGQPVMGCRSSRHPLTEQKRKNRKKEKITPPTCASATLTVAVLLWGQDPLGGRASGGFPKPLTNLESYGSPHSSVSFWYQVAVAKIFSRHQILTRWRSLRCLNRLHNRARIGLGYLLVAGFINPRSRVWIPTECKSLCGLACRDASQRGGLSRLW